MSNKVTVTFVRHGQTIFNDADIVQGWGDSFLTPLGEKGVQELGMAWKKSGKHFDKAYASDSGRTLQTARIILNEMGETDLSIEPTPGFREYNFGAYEGGPNNIVFEEAFKRMNFSGDPHERNWTDMKAYMDTLAAIDKERRGHMDNVHLSEDYESYAKRIVESVYKVVDKARSEGDHDILIVSHGLTIQTIVQTILKDKIADTVKSLHNASVTTITFDDRDEVECIGFGEKE